MIKSLETIESLQYELRKSDAVLVYFSHEACNVCKVLKPKVHELLTSKFPAMKMLYADVEKHPDIAGQYRVFAVPSLLVFFAGQESFRFSRNLSIAELEQRVRRPYSMMFDM
ncbi:MAG: thioredoxin family protein [Candidatus Delongbacteria bacterium]|jgi:thioredoxin 1|nr:thioredoxin family protein [Candidatus Delongbacteria bacterium]